LGAFPPWSAAFFVVFFAKMENHIGFKKRLEVLAHGENRLQSEFANRLYARTTSPRRAEHCRRQQIRVV